MTVTAFKPSKLALGSAQFGLDYGAVNSGGRVPEAEVRAILALAAEAGCDLVDTATAYGEAEAVLGRALCKDGGMRIVTKVPPPEGLASRHVAGAVAGSLGRLGRDSVYGLLAHRADDLLGPEGEAMWRAMEAERRAGRVERIGASVYTAAEIAALRARYPLQLVQLPLSLLDQRLLDDGTLAALRADGVEVHARSVLLQGLLAAPMEAIGGRFAALRPHLAALDDWAARHERTRLELALGFVASRPEVGRIVVGVTSRRELAGLLAAVTTPLPEGFEPGAFALDDEQMLNPSLWQSAEPAYLHRSRAC